MIRKKEYFYYWFFIISFLISFYRLYIRSDSSVMASDGGFSISSEHLGEFGVFCFFLLFLFGLFKLANRYFPIHPFKKGEVSELQFTFLILIAIIIKILWISFIPNFPTMDAFMYYSDGLKLAKQGFALFSSTELTSYFPIGQKIYIALISWIFGHHFIAIKIGNLFLQISSIICTYLLTLKIFKNQKMAFLSSLLVAFYPNYTFYLGSSWTEPLFTLLTLLGFYGLVSIPSFNENYGWPLFAGVMFGLASLVRPMAPVYPLVYFILLIFHILYDRKGQTGPEILRVVKIFCIFYLTFFLVLSPWAIRNKKVFNEWTLTSSNGPMVLFINYVLDNDMSKLPLVLKPKGDVDPDKLGAEVKSFIFAHPLSAIKVIGRNFFHLYSNDLDGIEMSEESLLPKIISQDIFNKVITLVHPEINLFDLKKLFILHANDGSSSYHLNTEVWNKLSDFEKSEAIQTFRYSFAYPYRELESPFYRLIKFTNQTFYYFIVLLLLYFFITRIREIFKLSFYYGYKMVFLGALFILLNTLIYSLTVGCSRYHYPLMPWIFIYLSYFIHERKYAHY